MRGRTVYEHCERPLPVRAGTSSFGIRGEFYRHLGKTIAQVDDKSGGALLKLLEKNGLAAFQRQPFVSNNFYDNLPLPRIVMCIAEVTNKEVAPLTEKMGRVSAESQLKGKYKDVVAKLSAENFADAFSNVLGFYYNYGALKVSRGSASSLRVERGAIPLCVADWWSLVSVPFVTVALEQNGARDVTISSRIVVVDEKAAVPLGAVVWDIAFAS
jgi:hypothetical protein